MELGGPICEGITCLWFSLILLAPFIVGGAFVVVLLVRFAYRRRTGRRQPLRWSLATFAAALLLIPAALYAYVAIGDLIDARRAGRRNAEAIAFDLYVPARLPPGFEPSSARALGGQTPGSSAELRYERGDEVVTPARTGDPASGCRFHPLLGVSSNFYGGPCRHRVAPSGREWIEGEAPTAGNPGRRVAFVILDRSFVALYHPGLADAELEVFVDSLERRDPGEIDFRS
jgi:hypothetical protein